MYDDASLSDAPTLQRAVGELRVDLRVRDGCTVLEGLRQAGCLKARFPRPEYSDWANVVTLNTSGGIAGGDRLDSVLTVRKGARATIAAQAAERFYRVPPGSAASHVRTRIVVADSGAVEWLPQETILFDRCALDRRLHVELAADARFLGVESLMFGRAAMGECVDHASVHDVIRIHRAGQLLLHDSIRLEGTVATTLQRSAIAGGARAVATMVYVAPDAEVALDSVREALAPSRASILPCEKDRDATEPRERVHPFLQSSPASWRGVQWGASAWNGMLVARILAADSASLRTAVVNGLQAVRADRPLPRVWLC